MATGFACFQHQALAALVMEIKISQKIRIISLVRAARMALGWSQPDLAERSGVSVVAIARLESASASPRLSTVSRIKDALTKAGIRILDDQPEGGYTITVSQRAVDTLERGIQTRRDDKESAARDIV